MPRQLCVSVVLHESWDMIHKMVTWFIVSWFQRRWWLFKQYSKYFWAVNISVRSGSNIRLSITRDETRMKRILNSYWLRGLVERFQEDWVLYDYILRRLKIVYGKYTWHFEAPYSTSRLKRTLSTRRSLKVPTDRNIQEYIFYDAIDKKRKSK